MVLLQASLFHGMFAAAVLTGFLHSVTSNENEIDTLKKESLRRQGLADRIQNRPKRTLRQSLYFIFGEQSLSLSSFTNPTPAKSYPQISFKLMIQACILEFDDVKTKPIEGPAQYQACDAFMFNKVSNWKDD